MPSNPANFAFRRRKRLTRASDYGAVPRQRRPWWRRVSPIMIVVPLGAFAAVLLWPLPAGPDGPASDTLSARFSFCDNGPRIDCVVDGDTFWLRGEKICLADINTPEIGEPACAREARLGAQASERLLELLNAGAFTLAPNPDGRDRDRYGRLLRTVTRDGESLGAVLVREGLAEEWRGSRSSWC